MKLACWFHVLPTAVRGYRAAAYTAKMPLKLQDEAGASPLRQSGATDLFLLLLAKGLAKQKRDSFCAPNEDCVIGILSRL